MLLTPLTFARVWPVKSNEETLLQKIRYVDIEFNIKSGSIKKARYSQTELPAVVDMWSLFRGHFF